MIFKIALPVAVLFALSGAPFSLWLRMARADARMGYPVTLDGTDVSAFGVKYDVRLAKGQMQGGSNRFWAAAGTAFSPADVGKDVIVYYHQGGQIGRTVRGNVLTGCIARVDGSNTASIGSWAGGGCILSNFPIPVSTGLYAMLYGTDNTAALQLAVDRGGNGILDLKGSVMIKNTLLFHQRTGKFEGLGSEGNLTGPVPSGSNIIWAGPAGIPMATLRNDSGMTLTNLHFVGNGNPAHRPSALLDLVQPITGGYRGINSRDSFINISNDPAGQLGQGPFADNGVLFENATQNDIHMFYSLGVFNVAVACINNENQQSVLVDFKDLHCSDAPMGWYAPHGGSALFTGLFMASNVGQVFHLGRGARATVSNLRAENSSAAQAGYSQLAYLESNTFGGGGGSILILGGSFQISSNIPSRAVSLVGHPLTPYAVIDSDNPLLSDINLENFSFTPSYTSRAREWFINLGPIRNLNYYYFRCYLCSGLTQQSLSRLRSGTHPYSITFVEIKQTGPPMIQTRQVLRNGAAFLQ